MAQTGAFLMNLYLVTLFQLGPVLGLECYTCDGPVGLSACASLSNIRPHACSAGSVCGQYILIKPNVEILNRTCANNNFCSLVEANFVNNPGVSVRDCRICNEDLCNSANIKGLLVITTVIVIATLSAIF